MKNTNPKEILENIIKVMEKTHTDTWEIDKLVVVLNYINELEYNRDKAIEYLKDNACYENTISELFCDDLDTDSCMELLNILRGETNE